MKIISILSHPPAYDMYKNEPRPKVNWDTQNGKWVGIWGYDWPDLLGNEILKITDEFEYEVWQPDLRADKVYEHKFENGLVHKLFPALIKEYWYGTVKKKYVFSHEIINNLKSLSNSNAEKIILHLSIMGNFNLELLNIFSNLPVVGSFHGEISFPYNNLYKFRKNIFAIFTLIKEQKRYNTLINNYNFITYQSEKNIKFLRKIYFGPLQKLTMGCNFELFQNRDRKFARHELGLPKREKIFLSVCRLNPLKQIDKLIEVFNELTEQYNFLYLVVGTGNEQYIKYLKKKSKLLLEKGKIKFVGYKKGDELVNYYNAADLFINVSSSEAGPVVSMEALACETPIMTTDIGNVAEFLKENKAGIIVDTKNISSWREAIISFLNGKNVKIANRNIAFKKYDWSNIASKFLKIYVKVSGA